MGKSNKNAFSKDFSSMVKAYQKSTGIEKVLYVDRCRQIAPEIICPHIKISYGIALYLLIATAWSCDTVVV